MNQPSKPSEEIIFAEALELPAAQRRAFVERACMGDTALAARVAELLRGYEENSAFLETPPAADSEPAASVAATAPAASLDFEPGERIGPYRLLERIGEGACGVVYMAEQERPVRRRVALKLIKLGLDTREFIARFEAERQALALMDHPNIARVFDAGATESGRPYFVMELIRGTPITRYCDDQQLPPTTRLELFVQVCHAIQHAHQKGIIHRDLKPSNILVTVDNGAPVPKVIDFGVAKATQARLTDKTLFTRFHVFIGTPAYASPEQVEVTSADVDTRSDIYSLGVLLYEMLTGRQPMEQETLERLGFEELRRLIREVEPPRPSARVSSLGLADRTEVARRRGVDAARLALLLRSDLDWIVMRCLEKDRRRRYDSPNDLARDLERYMRDEPVTARPPSQLYVLRKLMRRHRVGFVATGAVAVSLVAGVVSSTLETRRAIRAERLAREERARAEQAREDAERHQRAAETEAERSAQVAQFMKDMLAGVGPQVALGRDTQLLRAIVDQTAARVQRDLASQPQVFADLVETLALTYGAIGEDPTAVKLLREALTVQESLNGRESLPVARLLHEIALALERHGLFYDVEAPLRESVSIRKKLLGERHPDVAAVMADLGRMSGLWWRTDEGISLLRDALALQRDLLGRENAAVADTLMYLGRLYSDGVTGRAPEGETFAREALAIHRRVSGPDAPATIEAEHRLAMNLFAQRRTAEAETLLRAAHEHCRAVLGDGHAKRGEILLSLVIVLEDRHQFTEAETLAREGLALVQKRGGGTTLGFIQLLVGILVEQQRTAEAEKVLLDAIENARIHVPEDTLLLAAALAHHVDLLLRDKRFHEAEAAARECLSLRERADNMGWLTQTTRRRLGEILAMLGRREEAETCLLASYHGLQQVEERLPLRARFHLRMTYLSLMRLYTAWGRDDEAAAWEKKFLGLRQDYIDRGRPDWAEEMRRMLAQAKATPFP